MFIDLNNDLHGLVQKLAIMRDDQNRPESHADRFRAIRAPESQDDWSARQQQQVGRSPRAKPPARTARLLATRQRRYNPIFCQLGNA